MGTIRDRLPYLFVVVVWIVGIGAGLLLFGHSGKQKSAPTASTPHSTITPTAKPPPNQGGGTRPDQLTKEVSTFVNAYYRIDPSDSEKTRKQRVASLGFVSRSTIAHLDFGVGVQTWVDATRIKNKWTQAGQAVVGQMRKASVKGSPGAFQ
jgi:hypothetical protein